MVSQTLDWLTEISGVNFNNNFLKQKKSYLYIIFLVIIYLLNLSQSIMDSFTPQPLASGSAVTVVTGGRICRYTMKIAKLYLKIFSTIILVE